MVVESIRSHPLEICVIPLAHEERGEMERHDRMSNSFVLSVMLLRGLLQASQMLYRSSFPSPLPLASSLILVSPDHDPGMRSV